MSTITASHRQMLADLVEAGHGHLDHSGRVCVGPASAPISGNPIAWLALVAHGYVAGERDLIIPTEAGRAFAERLRSGSVRESQG